MIFIAILNKSKNTEILTSIHILFADFAKMKTFSLLALVMCFAALELVKAEADVVDHIGTLDTSSYTAVESNDDELQERNEEQVNNDDDDDDDDDDDEGELDPLAAVITKRGKGGKKGEKKTEGGDKGGKRKGGDKGGKKKGGDKEGKKKGGDKGGKKKGGDKEGKKKGGDKGGKKKGGDKKGKKKGGNPLEEKEEEELKKKKKPGKGNKKKGEKPTKLPLTKEERKKLRKTRRKFKPEGMLFNFSQSERVKHVWTIFSNRMRPGGNMINFRSFLVSILVMGFILLSC